MSEEARRDGVGAPLLKPSSDDRKPSLAASSPSPSGKKVIIKSADMKDDLQKEAVDIAIKAFEMHNVEKDVAELIKKEFDKKHGPTWHCIVGKNFEQEEERYAEVPQERAQDKRANLVSTSLQTPPVAQTFHPSSFPALSSRSFSATPFTPIRVVTSLDPWGGLQLLPEQLEVLESARASHPETFEDLEEAGTSFLQYVYKSLIQVVLFLHELRDRHFDAQDFKVLNQAICDLKRVQLNVAWLEDLSSRAEAAEQRHQGLTHLRAMRDELEAEEKSIAEDDAKLEELTRAVEELQENRRGKRLRAELLGQQIEAAVAQLGPPDLISDLP